MMHICVEQLSNFFKLNFSIKYENYHLSSGLTLDLSFTGKDHPARIEENELRRTYRWTNG